MHFDSRLHKNNITLRFLRKLRGSEVPSFAKTSAGAVAIGRRVRHSFNAG